MQLIKFLFFIFFIFSVKNNETNEAQDECRAKEIFASYTSDDCYRVSEDDFCIELEAEEIDTSDGKKKITYLWNLGDGNTKKDRKHTYCYTKAGVYFLELYTILKIDEEEFIDTLKQEIIIDNMIVIKYKYYESVSKEVQVYFDASHSFISNDFTISNYYWNFGDSTYSCGMDVTHHVYDTKNNYTVKLIIEGMENGEKKRFCGMEEIKL